MSYGNFWGNFSICLFEENINMNSEDFQGSVWKKIVLYSGGVSVWDGEMEGVKKLSNRDRQNRSTKFRIKKTRNIFKLRKLASTWDGFLEFQIDNIRYRRYINIVRPFSADKPTYNLINWINIWTGKPKPFLKQM